MTTILAPTRASTTNKITLHSRLDDAVNRTLRSGDWAHSRATDNQFHSQTASRSALIGFRGLQSPPTVSILEGRVAMSQARVQEKDAKAHSRAKSGPREAGKENHIVNGWSEAAMKRKALDYEEDIEGFQFSRTSRSKKPRPSPEPLPKDRAPQKVATQGRWEKGKAIKSGDRASLAPDTPNGQDTRRRSKRLASDEPERPSSSRRKLQLPDSTEDQPMTKKGKSARTKASEMRPQVIEDIEERATPQPPAEIKVALPFADTPVIQRNKDMRQERGRGKRRSSFGMRGRRASSLIDSGASNALPHDKVDTADFYKHIESEDLSEPRRMRQLLTWCATRAIGEKPSGSRSEDESAKLAARVIQEEILKELSNRSELSDWSNREETASPAVVVKKPNPKNIQNAEKIKELEEHILRQRAVGCLMLRTEKKQQSESEPQPSPIDSSLLDPSQQSLLDLTQAPIFPPQPHSQPFVPSDLQTPLDTSDPVLSLTTHLSSLSSSLAPILDSFAAGIHHLELYRSAADNVAGGVLRACAKRLEERDLRASEKSYVFREVKSEGEEGEGGGGGRIVKTEIEREDLRPVLGALSRLERR
ncbi:predicted protein [Uncinocarpus reesii 1704]|uniref:Mis12-Mtw1 protein n=1 Tax=Uncinocarpus reesii (strain UAMH 1704) TaxID=336963 RepID=C4JKY3_UNCRE|nr:uncharacterized protein UREG_00177 [Uncinocarpus reesii 1704]EEP75331.1 predicted protein [Uncinocarpus reesii 1704]